VPADEPSLIWDGKERPEPTEPRPLREVPSLSCRGRAPDAGRPSEVEGLIVQGDNLHALPSLAATHAGMVRCAFLDPPYNTGGAFEHYADGVAHAAWLGRMRAVLSQIAPLLRADGSLWITIDDRECHYLKVLCDEVLGRASFVASIAWQKVFAKKNKALVSWSHDHVLVYAKDPRAFRRNLLPRAAGDGAFKNPDGDRRGAWQSVSYSVTSEDATRRAAYRYPIALPAGGAAMPPPGRHWNGLSERTEALRREGRLWFGPAGDRAPRLKVFRSEVADGVVPDTWWDHRAAGTNQDAKKEMLALFPGQEPFGTPKPERLLHRVLTIATDPGDLVLDPFAGSGTTGAVAHKLGRPWILIELGEHAETHVAPRLRKVIDGADPGGVTAETGWTRGGSFRFLRTA
jgi:adenine-specific DNA-methyltransferase